MRVIFFRLRRPGKAAAETPAPSVLPTREILQEPGPKREKIYGELNNLFLF